LPRFIGLWSYGFLIPDNLFNTLFYFKAWSHKLMPATLALEPEIHADSKHVKLVAAAGMRLFHNQDIANTNIHACTLPSFKLEW